VFLGAPKTTYSARSLDMPTFVSNALRAHSEGPQTRAESPWRETEALAAIRAYQAERAAKKASSRR
jgi:hypothetical protein